MWPFSKTKNIENTRIKERGLTLAEHEFIKITEEECPCDKRFKTQKSIYEFSAYGCDVLNDMPNSIQFDLSACYRCKNHPMAKNISAVGYMSIPGIDHYEIKNAKYLNDKYFEKNYCVERGCKDDVYYCRRLKVIVEKEVDSEVTIRTCSNCKYKDKNTEEW